jgi:hypothetical protein
MYNFLLKQTALPSQSVNIVSMELNKAFTSSLLKIERFLIDILVDPAETKGKKYHSCCAL